MREITELMRELEVRIPVMGRAEESRGRNCRLGLFSKNLSFVEMAKFTVATGRACARLAGTEMASLKRVYEVYESLLVYTV